MPLAPDPIPTEPDYRPSGVMLGLGGLAILAVAILLPDSDVCVYTGSTLVSASLAGWFLSRK